MRCRRCGRRWDVVSDQRGASLVEYIILVALVALIALGGYRVMGRTALDATNREGDRVARLDAEPLSEQVAKGASVRDRFLPPPDTTWIDRSPARLTTNSPAPKLTEPTQLELARSLVQPGGSADASDAALVAAEVAKLPVEVLERLRAQGTHVVAARGSVTDYLKDLRGVHPRGWPPGASWDTVPGIFNRASNEVVIAIIGHETGNAHVPRTGEGHGAYNLVIHECFHALDGNRDTWSSSGPFETARDADKIALPPYELQAGSAGYEEAFAESAAHYYGGDPKFSKADPHLEDYWKEDPFD